jgi:hypothetical protein
MKGHFKKVNKSEKKGKMGVWPNCAKEKVKWPNENKQRQKRNMKEEIRGRNLRKLAQFLAFERPRGGGH